MNDTQNLNGLPEEQPITPAGEAPSDDPTQQTPASDPPQAPEVPELSYIYQPTDDSGRPIGGKQVIKYRTQEELAQKLQDQNVLLIRKLRETTRKLRLGLSEEDEISDQAPRLTTMAEFNPRELTQDERVRLSRELLDPETAVQATEAIFEASMGAKPKVLADTVRDLQLDIMRSKAVAEARKFQESNPDYVVCNENANALTGWITRYNLAPVKENFQKAFDTLKAAGVMLVNVPDTPVEEPVVPKPADVPIVPATPDPVTPPVVEPKPVEPPSAAPATPRIPTGLTRNNASDAGTPRTQAPGDDITFKVGERTFTGMAAINAMPADEFKRRLVHEKGFRDKYEKLEQAVAAKRKGR